MTEHKANTTTHLPLGTSTNEHSSKLQHPTITIASQNRKFLEGKENDQEEILSIERLKKDDLYIEIEKDNLRWKLNNNNKCLKIEKK